MACTESWKSLNVLNKCLLISTSVAIFSLIMGISTPFWITVHIPENSVSFTENFEADFYVPSENFKAFLIKMIENDQYFGLWQWCIGGNGCIDLGWISMMISNTDWHAWPDELNTLIDFWIATRVFAMLGFVTGVIVTSVLMWFICRRTTGTGRCSHGFIVIGCFVTELNKLWKDLETNLTNLSDVRYQGMVKLQIQNSRKLKIEREDISDLLKQITYAKQAVTDIHSHLNNNHKNVIEQVKEFEKLSMYGNLQLQKSIADESRSLKQRQEENHKSFSEKLEHQHAEMIKMKEIQEKMEVQQEKTTEEIIKMRESHEVFLQLFINKVRVDVNYDDPGHGQKKPSDKKAKEYAVLMNIKTPREWNDKAVADALKDYERMSDKQDIKTKFVREGSLIILTAVPYDILHDKVKYEHAIKMFLTRIMDVCNIDTKRACQVKATLHKLEVDEVNIEHSYVLCEDKATQISVPQADKCFQINNNECDEKIDPEELQRKRIIKLYESIDDDNFASKFHHHNRFGNKKSYHRPSRISSSMPSLPVDDVIHSNSTPNIYGKALASALRRTSLRSSNSARSLRSVDSSYGSTTSISGSEKSIEKTTPLSASIYLPREWKESTAEFKRSFEEIITMPKDEIEISSSSKRKSLKDKKCSIQ